MSLERTVINNIRRIRKEKNISQEKLAEYCGTSTSYIGLMETYRNIPKLSTIEKIAAALNVSPQELFEDGDDPNRAELTEHRNFVHEKIKNSIMNEFEQKIDLILKSLYA